MQSTNSQSSQNETGEPEPWPDFSHVIFKQLYFLSVVVPQVLGS